MIICILSVYIYLNTLVKIILKEMEKGIDQDGRRRRNIRIGSEVEIVQKHHQQSGELTDGIVKRILTKSPNHPHGIKVQLETGEVGRVKTVLPE